MRPFWFNPCDADGFHGGKYFNRAQYLPVAIPERWEINAGPGLNQSIMIGVRVIFHRAEPVPARTIRLNIVPPRYWTVTTSGQAGQ